MIYDFEYIPDGWMVKNIQKVGKVVGGGTPDTQNEKYWGGDINWFTPSEITNLSNLYIRDSERKITKEGLNNSSANLIPENSLLFTSRATIGACAINTTLASTNQGFQNIVPNENISVKYLYYFFRQPLMQNRFIRRANGSTFLEVTGSEMKKTKILQPPKLESIKIVNILENVDNLIQATQRLIEKLQECKKGLMQRLFTEGIGHTEFKETKLGKIPKEWEIVKLEKIVEIFDSQRIPLSQAERNERKGNYPYCGANNIIDYIDDYLFDGEYVLLAEDGGAFGNYEQSAYIMNGKFWVNNHAHVLKAVDGKSNNFFLLYCLNYLNLIPYTVGSTRIKLNQADLRNIKSPLPSLEEQIKIGNIFRNIDNKIENELRYIKKIKKLKKGLMQVLLTGKKRVSL